MGFSISGSFAILLVATLVAFGMFYGATSNKTELVTEAKQASSDADLAAENTAIEITQLRHNGTHLRIDVNNTGATTLSVNGTDVIVDGTYQQRPFDKENVEGDSDTDLWQPGEELRIRIRFQNAPDRVKVVTEHGIAATGVM